MKKKITLELDATLLREAKVLAAEQGTSINSFISEQLEALVGERRRFEKARRRALARLRRGLDLHWEPEPRREDLHRR